jgi:uncharacterized phage protein (TIGR02220 family)
MISLINHNYRLKAGLSAIEYIIADWIEQINHCQQVVTSHEQIANDIGININTVSKAIKRLLGMSYLERDGFKYLVTPKWCRLSKLGLTKKTDKLDKLPRSKPNQHKELCIEIIEYLNSVANRNFNSKNKEYHEMIQSLIVKDPKLEFTQFKAVIDYKYEQWGGDDNMDKFIRPHTLFLNKFFIYLDEAREDYITKSKESKRLNKSII